MPIMRVEGGMCKGQFCFASLLCEASWWLERMMVPFAAVEDQFRTCAQSTAQCAQVKLLLSHREKLSTNGLRVTGSQSTSDLFGSCFFRF